MRGYFEVLAGVSFKSSSYLTAEVPLLAIVQSHWIRNIGHLHSHYDEFEQFLLLVKEFSI
jgi:hypothetical protein